MGAHRVRLRTPDSKRFSCLRTGVMLALLLGIALPFLGEIPLGESWRELLVSEFKRRGIHIDVAGVAISPTEGLIAHSVSLYSGEDRGTRLAEASRIAVAVGWHKILRKQLPLDTIDLVGARVEIPPSGLRSFPIVLTDAGARIHFAENQIRVARARADLLGLRINASGTLLNPGGLKVAAGTPEAAPPKQETPTAGWSPGADIPALLRAFRFDRETSRVDVDFSGDGSDPGSLVVKVGARINSPGLGSFQGTSARIDLRHANGVIELPVLELVDATGRIAVCGHYAPGKNELRLIVESGANLQGLLTAVARAGFPKMEIPPALDELKIGGAQTVRLTVERSSGSFLLTGSCSLNDIHLPQIHLKSAFADFSTDGRRFMLRGLHLRDESGSAEIDCIYGGGPTRVAIRSSINPAVLRPFLPGRALQSFDEFEFIDAPVIEFQASGSGLEPDTFTGSGSMRLGRTVFRKVPIKSANSEIVYGRGSFAYNSLWVERNEGFLGGTFVYDFANSEVRMENLISTLDPYECIVWVDPRIQKDLRMFRFSTPPTLRLDGHAQFGGKTDVDLRMRVDAPAGFQYDVLGKWLPVDSATGLVKFSYGRLDITDLKASTLGGSLLGNIFVSLLVEDKSFGASLDLDGLDFEKFTRLYFNYEDSEGSMRARYRFRSQLDDQTKMNGDGTVVVTNGNIFAIPVFGPLSGLLNEVVPGIGYSKARRAFASFKVTEGVANTEDFEVQGVGFTMVGGGALDFVKDAMNFDVRVNARGVPGLLLFPVSKLFEFTSTERLSKPNWRPKLFSLPPKSARTDRDEASQKAKPKKTEPPSPN